VDPEIICIKQKLPDVSRLDFHIEEE